MTAGDWPRVLEIYAQGIATSLATFETTLPSWEAWDAGHHPFARIVACGGDAVALHDDVAGWAALSPMSRRDAYRGVAEVSVYVGEGWRGRGVGHRLLGALVGAAEDHGVWTLQASVFAENTPSIALHHAHGFRTVGRRERIGALHGVWHDTVLLERRSTTIGAA